MIPQGQRSGWGTKAAETDSLWRRNSSFEAASIREPPVITSFFPSPLWFDLSQSPRLIVPTSSYCSADKEPGEQHLEAQQKIARPPADEPGTATRGRKEKSKGRSGEAEFPADFFLFEIFICVRVVRALSAAERVPSWSISKSFRWQRSVSGRSRQKAALLICHPSSSLPARPRLLSLSERPVGVCVSDQ